ncbi:Os05g0564700 [Oryza sativa Japonica Group]|uniref:Os05g0564700 protein n=1 Tax=Oryza sativa subsp. japonica TaxID=39947 RepID=A0A0P0WR52_ORYSJ|nr:hypothetical protein EE612_031177 [Oryza sativa]BAS95359.1 Os05g0564700 [Oryza sativa Japonica Group]
MAIGAAPASNQPHDTSNILENVWASIMTSSSSPAVSSSVAVSSSAVTGQEENSAILQRLPSLGRWISMGAEEWDELLLSGAALASESSGELQLVAASPARSVVFSGVQTATNCDHMVSFASEKDQVSMQECSKSDAGVIDFEEIGGEYWDYLFPPLV